MLLWIILIVAVVAAVSIAVVFVRHWKEIRLLDPDTIKAEQERKVRERIVRQRFDRRLRHLVGPMERAGRTFFHRVGRAYRQAEERLMHAAGADAPVGATDPAIEVLLKSADQAVQRQEWAAAERTYLEILKQDSRQMDAYRGLGVLYMHQRSFTQAKETFRFLERINGCDDACYASLGQIATQEGNVADAESWYKRAVDTSPKNPIRHRELAKFYLSQGMSDYAVASARRAADLGPDDPVTLELSVETAILVRDRAEAERRYEQLRTLPLDRQILQSLREKIDAME